MTNVENIRKAIDNAYIGKGFNNWRGTYDEWFYDRRIGEFISFADIVEEYFSGEWWEDTLSNYIKYLFDHDGICDLETAKRIINERVDELISSWNRQCEKASDNFDECENGAYDFEKMALWERNYADVFNAYVEQMNKCDSLIAENK